MLRPATNAASDPTLIGPGQFQHRYMQTEVMAELTPPLIDALPPQITTVAA